MTHFDLKMIVYLSMIQIQFIWNLKISNEMQKKADLYVSSPLNLTTCGHLKTAYRIWESPWRLFDKAVIQQYSHVPRKELFCVLIWFFWHFGSWCPLWCAITIKTCSLQTKIQLSSMTKFMPIDTLPWSGKMGNFPHSKI